MGLLDTVYDASPIGQIGGILKGPGTPSYQTPDLDQGTKDAITGQIQRSQRPQDAFTQETLQGTDTGGNLAQAQKDLQTKSQALGGPDYGAMNQALTNRATKYFNMGQNQLQRGAQAAAPGQQFTASQMAQQNQLKQLGIQMDIVNMQRKQISDQMSSRNSMISSLLSGAGAIGGAALGRGSGSGGGGGGNGGGGNSSAYQTAQQSSGSFNYSGGSAAPSSYNSQYFGQIS